MRRLRQVGWNAWLEGTSPDEAASRIADNCRRLVDAYQQAEAMATWAGRRF
jgi:hypothetical protein